MKFNRHFTILIVLICISCSKDICEDVSNECCILSEAIEERHYSTEIETAVKSSTFNLENEFTFFTQSSTAIKLVTTDVDLNILRSKTYGRPRIFSGERIIQTHSGGLAVITQDINQLQYFITYDNQGEELIALTFENSQFFSLNQDVDSNFILTGFSRENEDFKITPYFVKVSSSGMILLEKQIESINLDIITSTILAPDFIYCFGNSSNSTSRNTQDLFFLKMDYDGNVIIKNKTGETNGGFHEVVGNPSTGFYNIASLGVFDQDENDRNLKIIKLNNNGEVTWEKVFNTCEQETPRTIIETKNKDVIVGSWSWSPRLGSNDILITRINSSGEILWQKGFGTKGNDTLFNIYELPNSTFVIFGLSDEIFYRLLIDNDGNLI